MNTLKFGNGEWYGKKDTILAYNDENSNFKPLPFSFDRASSATVINKDGLIETVGSGEPRIDYSNDSKGALLLETTRSNSVDNSSNFFLNSWSGTRVSEGSTIVSPNGQDEAHKLIASSVSNTHYREYTISSASSGSYTGSCFFKKGEFNVGAIRMSVDSYANRYAIYIDLNDGTFLRDATVGSPTGTSYKIEDYGNGWYRLSVTITHTSGEVRMSLSNASSDYTNSNGLPVFLGNSSDGGYSWGAQLEQGSYATSYIPTSGGAVTRSQDVCSQTPPSGIIGQTEGTLFTEFEFNYSDSNTQVLLKANQSSDANSIGIEILGTTIKGLVNSQSLNLANIQGTIAIGKIKAAIAYKTNDIAFYVNGVQVGVISSGSIDFDGVVDILTIGHFSLNGGQYFPSSRPFNDVKLYNTRLSNAELQALTTL